jgi:hypothetical protein
MPAWPQQLIGAGDGAVVGACEVGLFIVFVGAGAGLSLGIGAGVRHDSIELVSVAADTTATTFVFHK